MLVVNPLRAVPDPQKREFARVTTDASRPPHPWALAEEQYMQLKVAASTPLSSQSNTNVADTVSAAEAVERCIAVLGSSGNT